jgi:hypothetical protein
MADDIPLDKQIKELEASKWNPSTEGIKAFVANAAPAMVTFGLGAAAVAGIGLVGMALFSGGAAVTAMTAAFGGPVLAVLGAGAAAGAAIGSAMGITGVIGAKRDTERHNTVLDMQINQLAQRGQSEGITVESPHLQQTEARNPGKDNVTVQKILQDGKKTLENTFSPGKIAERAAQNLGFTERLEQENATPRVVKR